MGGEVLKVVFLGVVKLYSEIECVLDVGICCFNVELIFELYCINEVVGKMGKIVLIFLCVNLDVDVKIYFYIFMGLKENKFGVSV